MVITHSVPRVVMTPKISKVNQTSIFILTLICARGGPDHPQCNRGRPITHLPMMPGSALNNFIVLLVKIFQAKKKF